ncbi:MAG: hypothetical protein QOD39_4592, partial [Mycobacterium sp.]|nr:hypothetical protein [Mycobacterium sp.]
MGYARHIGRVGALAVTLGVGVAIATAPGIAYGETAGSTTSTGDSSSTTTSSPGTAGTDGASADGAGGTDASASDPEAPSGSTGESEEGSDDPAVGDVEDAVEGGDEEAPADDEDTPPADSADDDQDSGSSGSDGQQVPHGTANAHASGLEDAAGLEDDSDSDDIDSTDLGVDGQSNQSGGQQAQTFSLTAADDAPARKSFASSSADALTMAATTFTAPAAPQQRTTLVGVVSDLVAAVLNPLLSPGNGSPFQISILTAVLSVVRNEFERVMFPRNANASSQQTVTLLSDPSTQPSLLVDPTNQHVLVIGVDGTNLSRILADDYNQNFFDLMDDGTTAASSIVGHTTISNPSWTSILTGVWGETTGVINNVFTPWTYYK